tara:strand:- start:16402 stop:18921 length:2520 start_codon:yes stop_codon:yes gene_type:complete
MAGSYQTRLGTSPEEGIKAPVVATTTVSINLTGEQTIGVVPVVDGQRVLVRSQNDQIENGIYNVRVSAWDRATDFNEANDTVNGVLVLDASNGDLYQASFLGSYAPGTTVLQFIRVLQLVDTGDFIPLSGTIDSQPITGGITLDRDATTGWTINQGELLGVNVLVLNANATNASFFIQTKTSAGANNVFTFTGDGKLFIPSFDDTNNEVWVIQGQDFLGTANAFYLYSFDQNTGLRTANPIFLQSAETEFLAVGIDGKAVQSGVVGSGDVDQVLATKIYVDNSIAGSGSLPPATAGKVLIGANGGGGWVIASHITIDEVTVGGNANIAQRGATAMENLDDDGEWMYISHKDFPIAGHGLVIAGTDTLAGVLIAPEGYGQPNSFSFITGFLSLPKLATANSHATSKEYVDLAIAAGGSDGLPTGAANNVLRHDGSAWVTSSAVTIAGSGALQVNSTIHATGLIDGDAGVYATGGGLGAANLVTTVGNLMVASSFGLIKVGDFNQDAIVLNTGVQTIAGTKTFSDNVTNVQNLTAAVNIASAAVVENRILVGSTFGIITSSAKTLDDLVLLTGAQTIAGAKTFSDDVQVNADLTAGAIHATGLLDGDAGVYATGGGLGAANLVTTEGDFMVASTLGLIKVGDFNQSEVVLTTGAQTIAGVKDFSSRIDANAGLAVTGTTTVAAVTISGAMIATSGGRFGSTLTAPSAASAIVSATSIALESMPSASGTNLVSSFGVVSLATSDERLKYNIRDSARGLDTIMAIRTIQFNWNPDTSEVVEDTGFSAQQLQSVLPEAAPYNEDADIYGFRDTPIVSALVTAMQQQQVMIEELQARLTSAGING